jgi:hypothetical protein
MADAQNAPIVDAQYAATLQDDHKAHPRRDAIAFSCLILGVITLVLALGEQYDIATVWHWVGVGLGAIGFGLSIYAQMVSATTRERWIIVPGWILAGTFGALNFWFAIG